ncbi:DUF4145 domain-containing protein [Methylophilus sp. QUAN]|uniref:DUF4145 domain-containing protein n=1 Tax=Methylophilus sp. QUAN TaxID=2781020 RepID=UPI00188F75AA|nr:DUF4145 domain-containing protein [Methylophilus sp. QUAN]MBF4990101.1 DUF4145 domain-containing protein [Methylophilus sp. QUAN]
MANTVQKTFIVDCNVCKAKVAAIEKGFIEGNTFDDEAGEPYGQRVFLGTCPSCTTILVGESNQIHFEGFNAYEDSWSDIARVYPQPPKSFSSWRIPRVVTDSLNEADRSLQAGANIAACMMLGRALEALCRDILKPADNELSPSKKPSKKLMLGEGIKRLRDDKVIDERLYDWSQQLQAFRNLAAHPEDISISREDASDLQIFVNAIVEYVYDLADRYDEFKTRAEKRGKQKK